MLVLELNITAQILVTKHQGNSLRMDSLQNNLISRLFKKQQKQLTNKRSR